MSIEQVCESVEVAGAGEGDVVFITIPAGTTPAEIDLFVEEFRKASNRVDGRFFPQCLFITKPGVTVSVAKPATGEE